MYHISKDDGGILQFIYVEKCLHRTIVCREKDMGVRITGISTPVGEILCAF